MTRLLRLLLLRCSNDNLDGLHREVDDEANGCNKEAARTRGRHMRTHGERDGSSGGRTGKGGGAMSTTQEKLVRWFMFSVLVSLVPLAFTYFNL